MRDKRASLPDITPEAIDAYTRNAGSDLHVALGLAPWEISPLLVATMPEPTEAMLSGRERIWWSSWDQAMRLREELERSFR